MRHRVKGKKFHRKRGERASFIRNLAVNIILKERVTTTETRAKAVKPFLERAVTTAKKGKLADRRLLISRVHDKKAVEKLMHDLGPRYKGRRGGYMRVVKTGGIRKRDGVKMARIEFV